MKKTAVFLLCGLVSLLSAGELTAYKTKTNSWDEALRTALAKERTVTVRQGTYSVEKTIEITRDTAIILEDGAVLTTKAPSMFLMKSGKLFIEGRGIKGELRSSAPGDFRFTSTERGSIFNMNFTDSKNPPSVEIRNLKITAYHGADGFFMRKPLGKAGSIIAENCHFICKGFGIGLHMDEIAFVRIENCLFEGMDKPVSLNSAIPGGAVVRGNILRDFGRSGIMLGKSGQIAWGCTQHLPNAIVHENQLLKGGKGETPKDSYTHGILIYGHNVSVQGNIVRDVNRGEPIPGQEIGRQIRTPDGKVYRTQWIPWKGRKRRLAGAAIYLKANRAIVSGNICTNSGWRSVIEIKTGGKEFYSSVTNNIVDGSALNTEESFGFECNAGRSVWSGNVVYNMPNQAFVIRSGYENTFLNNLIINAKTGFALSGRAPGKSELISGNRFIDVPQPVSIVGRPGVEGTAQDIFLPPAAKMASEAELPEPCAALEGRTFLQNGKFYTCVKNGSEYCYMELAGKIIPNKKYKVTGPELLFNADQSGKEKSSNPQLNNTLHPGWTSFLQSANEEKMTAEKNIAPDTAVFKTGTRSLKITLNTMAGSWHLKQPVKLNPGTRYRATALVKGEEPRNIRLEVGYSKTDSAIRRADDTKEWQLLTIDFTTPKECSGGFFSVWGSKTTQGKSAWIDSVSLREMEEEGVVRQSQRKTEGENLLSGKWSVSAGIKAVSGKNGTELLRESGKGNVIFMRSFTGKPGTEYRAELLIGKAGLADRVSPQVRIGKQKLVMKRFPVSEGIRYTLDFTLPEKTPKGQLSLWVGNMSAGEKIILLNESVRRIVK